MLDVLDEPDNRLLIWGLFLRSIGLTYIVAFGSFIPQVMGLMGSRSFAPVTMYLDRVRKDVPGLKKYWNFPTLLWINCSDTMIRALPIAGAVAGAAVATGGPWSRLAIVICHICALSIDVGSGFQFPWDSFLLETGFVCIFLPALPVLQFAASALPHPLVAWALRFLFFRVMFGFGKLKFTESTWRDRKYIKFFLVNMPMTNPMGWLGAKLPNFVHIFAVQTMFVVEILLPPLVFFCGWPRVIAGISFIALQLGIQGTGNFGYFNMLTAFVSLIFFDHSASVWDTPWSDMLFAYHASPELSWEFALAVLTGPLALLAALYYLLAGLTNFALNSWCSASWLHWAGLYQIAGGLQPWLDLLRFLWPLRMVHAYGVFPPHAGPACRWVVTYEGSADGKEWKKIPFKFMLSHVKDKPVVVAPHHPRLDHAVVYFASGLMDHTWMTNVGSGKPYIPSRSGIDQRLMARLLEGADNPVYDLFDRTRNPFPDPTAPPKYARASLYRYTPATLAHARKTGEFWHEEWRGLHAPTMEREHSDEVWEDWLGGPETWHWDLVHWRRRAAKVSKVATPDYELAWQFIQDVRRAAAVAKSESDEDYSLPDMQSLAAEHSLSVEDAARIFSWDTLPAAWRRVTTQEPWQDRHVRKRAELALARMQVALMSMMEALCFRQKVSDPQLEKEITQHLKAHPAGTEPDAHTQWWQDEYRKLTARTTVHPSGVPPAEATVSSPFRCAQYCQLIMLVGGRPAFERAVRGAKYVTMDPDTPTGPSTLPTQYSLSAQQDSRPEIFRRLNSPELNFAHLGVDPAKDAGQSVSMFLQGVFYYNLFAWHARTLQVPAIVSCDGMYPSGGVLPGFFAFIDVLTRHTGLPMFDHVTQSFVEPLNLSVYDWTEDGEWEELGTTAELGQDICSPILREEAERRRQTRKSAGSNQS